jgi:hypothetical protein
MAVSDVLTVESGSRPAIRTRISNTQYSKLQPKRENETRLMYTYIHGLNKRRKRQISLYTQPAASCDTNNTLLTRP